LEHAVQQQKARGIKIPGHDFFPAAEYIEALGLTAELEFEGQPPRKPPGPSGEPLNDSKSPRTSSPTKYLPAIYLENNY
jgi:hypothetical protein